MKALVIGGNGFIGAHLVDALLEAGHKVMVFDRYPSRYKEPLANVDYLIGDFANHGEVDAAVKGTDWVFHLAYTTLPETSNDDPVYDVRSNVVDTLQLLQSCREHKVRKFIFISSGGTVYGIPQSVPIKEDHPTNPLCSYGISKLTIEKYLHLFHKLYGLDYVVARLSNPYGELQNPFAKQGAIGVFLGKVIQGQPITIWGDGKVVRDYVYIKDAVKALVLAAEYNARAEDKPRLFNIGAGRGVTLNQIIAEIKNVVDMPVVVHYTPSRPVDVPVNVLDVSRAACHLEWQPTTPLQQGLERSWQWIKAVHAAAPDRLPERTV
jgi:UDP-glucose 4-epimerase